MKKNKDWLLLVSLKIYPCDMGGIEVFNHYLIKNLGEYHNLHLLTYCDKVEQNDKLSVHLIKRLKLSKITKPLQVLFFIIKNRSKIKLVHLSYARSHWLFWYVFVLLKKIFKINYIFTVHGGGMSEWKPKLPFKLFFKNASSVTGVSKRIVSEYKNRSEREIIFTPPLVPFEIITEDKKLLKERINIDSNQLVLLYVGSIKKLKRVDTLIESLKVIGKKKLKNLKLKVLICGDGDMRKELEDKAILYELDTIVTFLGNIGRDRISQFYRLADFYVICSEFEGLPISLLEAYANNIPCITSDAPGLLEMSQNNQNSLLFKVGNHNDLAEKIEFLIQNKNLQTKIRDNALNFYKNNFSYDNLIKKFNSIIENAEK